MRALLVGINQYKSISSLNGCHNDVVNVRDTLVATAGLKAADITILEDAAATAANIRKGLSDLAAGAKAGERLWFHYSGHGAQLVSTDPAEPDGLDETLCPYDFDWTAANAIRDDDLLQCIAAIPATSDLVVTLDCCHAGDYARAAVRTPHPVPQAVLEARRSRRSYSSLRAAGLGPNCLILSACQSFQESSETGGPAGAVGAFTNAFFAEVNAAPRESTRIAMEVATTALAAFNQTPVMEGSDRLRDQPYAAALRGATRNILRPRGGQILWSQEWGFDAAGSGGSVGARVTLVDGNFWLEVFVDMFGMRPTMNVPLSGDVDETFAIAFGFSLTVGARNFGIDQGRLSFQLKLGVKTPIPFIPPITVVDAPITIPLGGISRSTAPLTSLAELVAFQALQPKPRALVQRAPGPAMSPFAVPGRGRGPRGEAMLQLVLGPTDDDGTVYVDGNVVVTTRLNEVKQARIPLGDGVHSIRTTLKNSGLWGWRNSLRIYVNDQLVTTFDRDGWGGLYGGFISEAEANWDVYIKDGQLQNFSGG